MGNQTPVENSVELKGGEGGLLGFGILLIVLGGICALTAPLILLGQSMASRIGGAATVPGMVVPSALAVLGVAAALIGLGIGSIKARRWARALILVLSWLWLGTGVITAGVMLVVAPKLLASAPVSGPPLPAAARGVVSSFIIGFTFLGGVVLPGLLVLFYRRPQVKAICEARDSRPRWTDRRPLPVLALSLLLGLGAISMLPPLLLHHGVAPWFGRLLHGGPGALVLVTELAAWTYCAWAAYRLRPAGWWLSLVAFAVMTASTALTFSRVGPMDFYRTIGYPQQQIDQIQRLSFPQGTAMVWLTLLGAVPFLGFLFYAKRYFRRLSA